MSGADFDELADQRRGAAEISRFEGREWVALARTQRSLARVLLKRQRPVDARPLADEALAICRTGLGEQAPETQLSLQLQKTVVSALP